MNFLSANLKEESYANLKERLLGISNETEILNIVNLIQVKSSIYSLREKIINILKNLDEGDFSSLEALSKNVSKPEVFEKIFHLAKVYKKTDNAIQITGNIVIDNTIYEVARGNIDKAIEITNKIYQDNFYQSLAFSYISKLLTKSGNFDKALEIAYKIKIIDLLDTARLNICDALVQSGNIDKAIEIATKMIKYDYIADVSIGLAKSGNFDKAIEIANAIRIDFPRAKALQGISQVLIESGNIERAEEVANLIPREEQRRAVLQLIEEAKKKKSL